MNSCILVKVLHTSVAHLGFWILETFVQKKLRVGNTSEPTTTWVTVSYVYVHHRIVSTRTFT